MFGIRVISTIVTSRERNAAKKNITAFQKSMKKSIKTAFKRALRIEKRKKVLEERTQTPKYTKQKT